jgi:hypothetical protein
VGRKDTWRTPRSSSRSVIADLHEEEVWGPGGVTSPGQRDLHGLSACPDPFSPRGFLSHSADRRISCMVLNRGSSAPQRCREPGAMTTRVPVPTALGVRTPGSRAAVHGHLREADPSGCPGR